MNQLNDNRLSKQQYINKVVLAFHWANDNNSHTYEDCQQFCDLMHKRYEFVSFIFTLESVTQSYDQFMSALYGLSIKPNTILIIYYAGEGTLDSHGLLVHAARRDNEHQIPFTKISKAVEDLVCRPHVLYLLGCPYQGVAQAYSDRIIEIIAAGTNDYDPISFTNELRRSLLTYTKRFTVQKLAEKMQKSYKRTVYLNATFNDSLKIEPVRNPKDEPEIKIPWNGINTDRIRSCVEATLQDVHWPHFF
jgi:hypothetical protein